MRKKHPIKVRYALHSVGHAGPSSIPPADVVEVEDPAGELFLSFFVRAGCREIWRAPRSFVGRVSEEDMMVGEVKICEYRRRVQPKGSERDLIRYTKLKVEII
jgi:hypothetical protein